MTVKLYHDYLICQPLFILTMIILYIFGAIIRIVGGIPYIRSGPQTIFLNKNMWSIREMKEGGGGQWS